MPTNIKPAAIRAARTFAQAFAAVIIQRWLAGDIGVTVSGLFHSVGRYADAAAGTALLAAAGALGWNVRRPGPAV